MPDNHLYLFDKLCCDKENSIQLTFKRNQWHFFSNIKTDINKDEKSRSSQILCSPPTFLFYFFHFYK